MTTLIQTDTLTVKITPNDAGNPPGKLADAELHFAGGPLEGMKLIGFAIWERQGSGARNVTFPARQYAVNGERRSLYGELCKLELADGTLSGLAEAAFRRRSGTSREEEADLQSLRERHSALKAEQTLVEQAIVQAEAQALLAAEEQKQREAALAELLALEEQKKAVARREQELREALKPAKPAKSGSKRKK